MAFGIDNQRWNVQRQPEVKTNPLAAEAATLAANHPLRQGDQAVRAFIPDLAPQGRPAHAESNYVLRDKNQELAGIDFAAAPNIYQSMVGESALSRNARDQADQVINRALVT